MWYDLWMKQAVSEGTGSEWFPHRRWRVKFVKGMELLQRDLRLHETELLPRPGPTVKHEHVLHAVDARPALHDVVVGVRTATSQRDVHRECQSVGEREAFETHPPHTLHLRPWAQFERF